MSRTKGTKLSALMIAGCLLAIAGLSLAGCSYLRKMLPTAKKAEVTKIDSAEKKAAEAAAKADAALVKADDVSQKRISAVKANVTTARDAVAAIPESVDQIIAEGELALALARMQDVSADSVELAEGQQRRLLAVGGKFNVLKAAYGKAMIEGEAVAEEITASRTAAQLAFRERDDANSALTTARNEFKRQLEQNRKDNEKKLEEAREGVKRGQAKGLNWAGGICFAIFALGIGFGGLVGLRKTWIFALFGLMCFGLAQIVTQWWFPWAIGIATVSGVSAVVYYLWRLHQLGKLKEVLSEKVQTVAGALEGVVPVLDQAYETASPEIQKWLEQNVFKRIKMPDEQRAVVREIKEKTKTQPPFQFNK